MLHFYKGIRACHSVINLTEVCTGKFHVIISSVCVLSGKPKVLSSVGTLDHFGFADKCAV
jgi:hypothetical protein